MKTHKWNYSGDVNILDYGGKFARQSGKRQFQFVELVNFLDATGEKIDGKIYNVELALVDLDQISEKEIESAKRSCGWESMPANDEALAEVVYTYGLRANLFTANGNNARELIRAAKREANNFLQEDKLEEALERPVNRIGSTAREFMRGDLTSAMERGCESGRPEAVIMAKMYGIPAETINDARPADFLPFLFGYMAGLNGGAKETNPDTAPEYFRGFERGENVKAGKAKAPGRIQTAEVK